MCWLIGILSGVGGSVMYANATIEGLDWWQYMLITLVPTIIGIIGDFLIMFAKKKGVISEEDADKLIERKHAKEDETNKTEDKGEE